MNAKITSKTSFKISTLHENFVRFHVTECEIELSQEFWGKNEIEAHPTELYVHKQHHCYF